MTNHTNNTNHEPDYEEGFSWDWACGCHTRYYTIGFRLKQENAPLWRRILRLPRNTQSVEYVQCERCSDFGSAFAPTFTDDEALALEESFWDTRRTDFGATEVYWSPAGTTEGYWITDFDATDEEGR